MEKKIYTIKEIANFLNERNEIDQRERKSREIFKHDKFLVMDFHEIFEEKRQRISWVFDLDIKILMKARKYMKGDRSIDGNEKIYVKF